MNNFKYDFDRARTGTVPKRRLRFILLFAAVLAVTGAIVYLLIPHEASPTPPAGAGEPKTGLPETTESVDQPRTAAASQTTEQPASSAGTPETPETESPSASSSGAEAEPSNLPGETAPTVTPEKGKLWIGDAPDAPKPR